MSDTPPADAPPVEPTPIPREQEVRVDENGAVIPMAYKCEHYPEGTNDPCICHKIVDRAAEVQPPDWYETYESPTPGTSDEVVAG